MEDKTFELLSKMYSEMQQGFNKIEEEFKGVNFKIAKLEKDVEVLKEGQEEIKYLITELDPKNANKHMELTDKIDEFRKDLNDVEIVMSKNWNDIAKLKSIKQRNCIYINKSQVSLVFYL